MKKNNSFGVTREDICHNADRWSANLCSSLIRVERLAINSSSWKQGLAERKLTKLLVVYIVDEITWLRLIQKITI